MKAWYGIFFLFVLAILPECAYAFTDFVVKPGGCSDPTGFQIDCNDDPKNGLFSAIACKVMTVYNQAIIPLYCNMVANSGFLNILAALLTLYIIFSAITYLFGLANTNKGDFTIRVLKFAFIFYFLTNQDIFFNLLYSSVVSIPEIVTGMILEAGGGNAETFYKHVDKGIYELFQGVFYPELENGSTAKKADFRIFVLGLALWKLIPGGAFLGGFFFSIIIGWLGAYVSIMVRYLLAIMTLIFLMMLAPIFITSLLFDKTKFLGDEWIKMISSFMLQVVIVVTFLIMIEDFYFEFYEMIKVAYNEIIIDRTQVGQVFDYGSVAKLEEESGISFAGAEKYVVDAKFDIPPGKEFLPWFVGELVVMAAVIYLTSRFLSFVPAFAGYLAGNPKFVNLMTRAGDPVSQGGQRAPMPFESLRQKLFGRRAAAQANGGNPLTGRRAAASTEVQTAWGD